MDSGHGCDRGTWGCELWKVPEAPWSMATWRGWGAGPPPESWDEVLQGPWDLVVGAGGVQEASAQSRSPGWGAGPGPFPPPLPSSTGSKGRESWQRLLIGGNRGWVLDRPLIQGPWARPSSMWPQCPRPPLHPGVLPEGGAPPLLCTPPSSPTPGTLPAEEDRAHSLLDGPEQGPLQPVPQGGAPAPSPAPARSSRGHLSQLCGTAPGGRPCWCLR